MVRLTLDCAFARVLGAFWKIALGYDNEPAPAPFRSRGEWLASFGEPAEDADKGAWLCDPAGIGPNLSILPVPEPKVAKNRLHIDVGVSGEGSEDERWARVYALAETLVAEGGHVLHAFPTHHIVMADPEGNEFCVGVERRHDAGS